MCGKNNAVAMAVAAAAAAIHTHDYNPRMLLRVC